MLHWFRPHHQIRRLHELDCQFLRDRGIRGVMIDLDNTLARWRCQEVSADVEAWVATLHQAGLRGCVVTNAATVGRVRPVAERLGLLWVTNAIKPLRGGFLRGMRLLKTTPESTAMVGDQLLTDVFGGHRVGVYTILVDPISTHEAWPAQLVQRPVERLIGRVPRRA